LLFIFSRKKIDVKKRMIQYFSRLIFYEKNDIAYMMRTRRLTRQPEPVLIGHT